MGRIERCWLCPLKGGSADSNPVGATHRSSRSLIICHWFVIEFCRYLAAPGVPEGCHRHVPDAVAEAPTSAPISGYLRGRRAAGLVVHRRVPTLRWSLRAG